MKKNLSFFLCFFVMLFCGVARAADVAEVGGVKYATFAEAVVAAKSGETVKLLDDVTLTDCVSVGSSTDGDVKSITLDLNDKIINVDTGWLSVYTDSTLTLTDAGTTVRKYSVNTDGSWSSDENGTKTTIGGVILANGNTETAVVVNGGTFVMNGGNIVGCQGANYGSAVGVSIDSVFTMNGGTIAGHGTSATVSNNGTFNMTGGSIVGENKQNKYGVSNESDSNTPVFNMSGSAVVSNFYCGVNVKSGCEFNMSGGVIQNCAYDGVDVYGTFTMTGGTIRSTIDGSCGVADFGGTTVISGNAAINGCKYGIYLNESNAGTVTISGGTYDFNPSAITGVTITDGFEVKNNGDGSFTVAEVKVYVAEVGGVKYETLQAAIAAARGGTAENPVVIQFLAGTFELGTVKFPAEFQNVTFRGAENKTTILKNTLIRSADGNTLDYQNITFDGIVFDNSQLLFTGHRTGAVTYGNWTITNCEFRNIDGTVGDSGISAVHFNLSEVDAMNGFTFTDNVIDGVTHANASGLLVAFVSDAITISGNRINNVKHNAIQIGGSVGVAGKPATLNIANNEISNTGDRAIRLGNVTETGTTVSISGNAFTDAADADGELIKATKIGTSTDVSVTIQDNAWTQDGVEKSAEEIASATINLVPEVVATNWIQVADTAWYNETDSTFTLTTAEELAGLAKLVNEGKDTFAGKTIKLDADVDLGGKEWTPIGNSSTPFYGTFDGNNKRIRNLRINMPTASYVGLLGYAGNVTLKNIIVENADVTGSAGVGVVAGGIGGSVVIENCHLKETINVNAVSYYAGGIVGLMYNTKGSVNGCTSEGTLAVTGGGYLGGLVGCLWTSSPMRLENCSAKGEITVAGIGDYGAAAGLFGTAQSVTVSVLTNCHLEGKIRVSTTQYQAAGIISGAYVGKIDNCTVIGEDLNEDGTQSFITSVGSQSAGIIAWTGESSKSIIQNCKVSNVAITAGTHSAAGVAGIAQYGLTIQNCTVEDVHLSGGASKKTSGLIAGTHTRHASYPTNGTSVKLYNNTVSGGTTLSYPNIGDGEFSTEMIGLYDYGINPDATAVFVGENVTFDDAGKVMGGTFTVFDEAIATATILADGYIAVPDNVTSPAYWTVTRMPLPTTIRFR